MTSIRTALTGVAVVTALLVSACGNGPPPNSQAPGAQNTQSSGGGGGGGGGSFAETVSGQPAAATVKQTDTLKFEPASVTAKVGDVVQWTNGSSVVHNVTFDNGPASPTMNSGDTFELKFTKAGSYHYVCTFHPGMEGTVTVS